MKKLILLMILTFPFIAKAQGSCECNINNVLTVDKNLQNLSADQIDLLLCTFDDSCENNAEYGQFSNEVLYKVLNKEPGMLIERLAKIDDSKDLDLIIKEIESPIYDFDLQEIKAGLSKVKGNRKIKILLLNAVDKAIASYN